MTQRFVRVDKMFTIWLAEIGGSWAFIKILIFLMDFFDDAQLYVIADLIAPYKTKK